MANHPKRLDAILRGLSGHCPNCGKGPVFRAYLKVNAECPACGHPLGEYRADDGPAYLTILLVGHLIVAPALFFPFFWRASVWLVIPLVLVVLSFATLVILPRVKGGFIGLLYSLKTRGEHPPGAELAASDYEAAP